MTLNPETVPARHETPDVTELRRLAEAANREAVTGATYERDWPLSSRAVGYFLRALNPDVVLALLDELDELRAEVKRLTALVEAVREYAAARQANIDHGPLLSARKAAHDALLAALARLDASADA